MTRSAFTLMEVLVVISILVLLSAILIPAVAGASRNARSTQCANNLKEIARAILEWRNNIGRPASMVFPARAKDLLDESKGGPLADARVFVCPEDPSGGHDDSLNAGGIGDDWGNVHESGCSYLYECSNRPSPWSPSDFVPSDVHVPNDLTWAGYKRLQKQYGNKNSDGDFGSPFSDDVIPILRCFYHHDWEGTDRSDMHHTKRVLNAAWSTTTFWSIPYWEHQANPDIPIP